MSRYEFNVLLEQLRESHATQIASLERELAELKQVMGVDTTASAIDIDTEVSGIGLAKGRVSIVIDLDDEDDMNNVLPDNIMLPEAGLDAQAGVCNPAAKLPWEDSKNQDGCDDVVVRGDSCGSALTSSTHGSGAHEMAMVDIFSQRAKSNTSDYSYLSSLPKKGTLRWRMRQIVESPKFECAFAAIIMMNAFVMAAEVQYHGYQLGYELEFRGYTKEAVDVWPHAGSILEKMSWVFGIIFAAEVCFKLAAQLCMFFTDVWNLLDLMVVGLFGLEAVAWDWLPQEAQNMLWIRLVRLARVGRFLRLVRTVEGFDALYLISTSIKGSMRILGWASIVLFVMQMAVALFLSQLLHVTYFDGSTRPAAAAQQEIYKYFGTWSRAMLSLAEMTLANWPPICRLLSEEVSEWFMLFCVAHKVTAGFAVVGVINGVFMQESFKVAATDDNIMVRQKAKAARTHSEKMRHLFAALDLSGDGKLSFKEFQKISRDPQVQTWLASMELQTTASDLYNLFVLIDEDQDGNISAEELIQGVTRLRGNARSLDLVAFMNHSNAHGPLPHNLLKHHSHDGVASTTSLHGSAL